MKKRQWLWVVIACVLIGVGYVRLQDIADTAKQAADGVSAIQAGQARGRPSNALVSCSVDNAQSMAVNRQTDILRGMITDGAKQSRLFNDIYRQYGAPSYKEWLEQAEGAADRLNQFKVPLVNCEAFVHRVRLANEGEPIPKDIEPLLVHPE